MEPFLSCLGSPVASTRRYPIALKMTPVDPPYTPIVSTAIKAAYLRRLCSSALFAAAPAYIVDLMRSTLAKVSTHVKSETKLLPLLNRKTVVPSGCDPSPLSNSGGYKIEEALKRSLNHIIHCRMPWRSHPLLTKLLSAQVSGRCSQYILQLWYCKGILQQNNCLVWVQHLQPWRHSLKRFPLLMDCSWNALYIHSGSQHWEVTRFNHPKPRKQPSEQCLRCLQLSLRLVNSHLLPLTSKPIALCFSSNTTKSS